jgi:hypothetical protein
LLLSFMRHLFDAPHVLLALSKQRLPLVQLHNEQQLWDAS